MLNKSLAQILLHTAIIIYFLAKYQTQMGRRNDIFGCYCRSLRSEITSQ